MPLWESIIHKALISMLNSVDVDDVAPPTVKLNGVKCHASLLSKSYWTTLYILVLMKFLVSKASREFR